MACCVCQFHRYRLRRLTIFTTYTHECICNQPHIRDYTLRSGICYHKSVCLSLCRLLSVCLSITFVQLYSSGWIFHNGSMPFCTLAICWRPCKISRRLSLGTPPLEVKRKKGQPNIAIDMSKAMSETPRVQLMTLGILWYHSDTSGNRIHNEGFEPPITGNRLYTVSQKNMPLYFCL